MHLKYCSITGADDAVNIEDLSDLAERYPFLECAILLLPSEAGKPRFPTAVWIKKFIKEYRGQHTATHLCGQALLDFSEGRKIGLMEGFKRIQLNLKFNNAGEKCDLAKLAAQVKAHPKVQFILQYTADQKDRLLPLFKDIPNHALLFDTSAGQGISPDHWPSPVKGHFCGYAGGINPDNLKRNLELIAKAAGDQPTWIDMETGVRTDDRFDLEKVRRVLEIAKGYAN